MAVAALISWIVTALAGLFLLAIWLIEYDPDFQHAAATRLPIPLVCGHVLFALGGLASWLTYVVTDKRIYSVLAAWALGPIALLGVTMAVRWFRGYRVAPSRVRAQVAAGRHVSEQDWPAPTTGLSGAEAALRELAVPPERHFPVSAVVAHGILAATTIILVVLTVMGEVGGS